MDSFHNNNKKIFNIGDNIITTEGIVHKILFEPERFADEGDKDIFHKGTIFNIVEKRDIGHNQVYMYLYFVKHNDRIFRSTYDDLCKYFETLREYNLNKLV